MASSSTPLTLRRSDPLRTQRYSQVVTSTDLNHNIPEFLISSDVFVSFSLFGLGLTTLTCRLLLDLVTQWCIFKLLYSRAVTHPFQIETSNHFSADCQWLAWWHVMATPHQDTGSCYLSSCQIWRMYSQHSPGCHLKSPTPNWGLEKKPHIHSQACCYRDGRHPWKNVCWFVYEPHLLTHTFLYTWSGV